MKKYISSMLVLIVFSALLISGCKDSKSVTGTDNNPNLTSDNVSVSFATEQQSLGKAGNSSITIDSVKLLIKYVQFKKPNSDSSVDVKIGPYIMKLGLSSKANQLLVGKVPADTYNRVKFKIHKPEDFEPVADPDFRDGSSGNERYAVVVKGSYNGQAFVFKSSKSSEQLVTLNPPLVLGQDSSVNVTITVDVNNWFVSNGQILDPANSSNRDEIEDNIKNSFKRGFKDKNGDGKPDDN